MHGGVKKDDLKKENAHWLIGKNLKAENPVISCGYAILQKRLYIEKERRLETCRK